MRDNGFLPVCGTEGVSHGVKVRLFQDVGEQPGGL